MNKYRLMLCVMGQTQRSQTAISNLQRICQNELQNQYEMVVIDVLEQPQLTDDEN